MPDDAELEEAFEAGRRVGQREGLGLVELPAVDKWLPGARLEFRRSWFDSFADYERHVMLNLRILERMRWHLRHNREKARAALSPHLKDDLALASLESEIRERLWRARDAVDAEIEEGRGKPAVVAALRALPQRPASAIEYESLAAFVSQDPRRGASEAAEPKVRAGRAVGYNWRLEHPFRRWETSRWRISWLCDVRRLFVADERWKPREDVDVTNELIARETLEDDTGAKRDGRVWLLGALQSHAAVDEALNELHWHAINERNSLVAAAEAVARVSR